MISRRSFLTGLGIVAVSPAIKANWLPLPVHSTAAPMLTLVENGPSLGVSLSSIRERLLPGLMAITEKYNDPSYMEPEPPRDPPPLSRDELIEAVVDYYWTEDGKSKWQGFTYNRWIRHKAWQLGMLQPSDATELKQFEYLDAEDAKDIAATKLRERYTEANSMKLPVIASYRFLRN